MKDIFYNYIRVFGYILMIGIFSLGSFLLIINIYHYKELNTYYQKQDEDYESIDDLKEKLSIIRKNAMSFSKDSYKGSEDINNMVSIQEKLNYCVNKIDSRDFDNIFSRNEVNNRDIYMMIEFYNDNIVDECLVKQLYSLSVSNKNEILFLDDNIDQLIKKNDYISKVMKNNSSYFIVSRDSKINIFDNNRDSYYEVFNSYKDSINLIYNLSNWYKEKVG